MAKFEARQYRRYNESELQNYTRKELNALYRQYRNVANKRLAAIGKSEEFRESMTYRANVGQYSKAPSTLSRAEIVGKIAQASRMLSAQAGSLSGLQAQAEKTVQTLQAAGFTYVTRENLREFGEFMEFARAKYGRKYYGSEQVADLYDIAKGKGITVQAIYREFSLWRDKRYQLVRLEPGDYRSGREIRLGLGIEEE